MYVVFFVFFFKQKTAYELRISDWSSDVCSSDLFIGSIGVFFTLFMLFIKFLPGVAMAEVKLLLKSSSVAAKKRLAAKEGKTYEFSPETGGVVIAATTTVRKGENHE